MTYPRLLPIVLTLLVSAAGCVAGVTARAEAAPPATAATAMAPIEFYLARGDADACGPGCNQWIAAEGKIDAGAAQRLRRLLSKLGRPRPPIYFHSPGGAITGALELGRLIREQKLEVSVGHTIAPGCDRDKPPEKSCEAQKRSGQAIDSELDPDISMCNSACVYALAGGSVRQVPPWVKLAIHDVGFDPAKTPPRGALLGEAKAIAHEHIQEYLREMGIDGALYKAALAIPFESKRFLERDELVRFGLDRREFGETGWQLVEKPVPALSKRFFARTDSDKLRYLDGAVFVSAHCAVGQAIRLVLAREQAVSEISADGPRSLSVNVNGRRVDLRDQTGSARLDLRWASLSPSTFDAVDDATIGLSGLDLLRNDETAGVSLSMRGFSAEYAKLQESCDTVAHNAVAAPPPTQPVPYLDTKSVGTPPASH